MKKTSSFPMYFLILPLVIVITLIYGGLVQRILPAVEVDGETYSVPEFNYYYFTEYLDFTDENYDQLEALGLDTSRALDRQSCQGYDSWEDYFKTAALERMAEVSLLLEQAEANGYAFTESDLRPYQEELDGIDAHCASAGITFESYLQAYYEASMTEDVFLEQLERDVRASAYKQALMSGFEPGEDAVAQWLAANPISDDYYLANLDVIWFEAVDDRFSGEFGKTQKADMEAKAQLLLDMWQEEGETETVFFSLAERFSESDVITYDNMDRGVLPEELDDWCFDSARQPGDTTWAVSEDGTWVIYYRGAGTAASQAEAVSQLLAQSYKEWYQEHSQGCVIRERFGMALAM